MQPGTYYVRTRQHPVFGFYGMRSPVELAYPRQYYPEGDDIASAQAQVLKGGDTAEADFTLKPKQTFQVSGTISGAANFLAASFKDSGPADPIPVCFDRQTGRFVLNMVPVGTWTVDFVSNEGQGKQLFATQQIKLNGFDVDGLQVVLQPGISIPVTVQNAPANSGNGIQVQVRLESVNTGMPSYYAAPVNPQSPETMQIQNVRPGTYTVWARALGNTCLDSVTMGNADLLHNNISIEAGAQPEPIVVTLRNDCAQLNGIVRSAGNGVMSNVILIPDSGGDPIVFFTPGNGKLTARNLTPGSYRVYAFANVDGLEYTNPEAMRGYPAQQISLAPNQQATIELDVIERKGE